MKRILKMLIIGFGIFMVIFILAAIFSMIVDKQEKSSPTAVSSPMIQAADSPTIANQIIRTESQLTINDKKMLLFNGQPFSPEIQGNTVLDIEKIFHMNNADVALIQNTVDTTCPARYYFITMSSSGAKATPAFGSCAVFVDLIQEGDTITVSMPGFMGPFESKEDREKAERENHIYTYKEGVVYENNNPVFDSDTESAAPPITAQTPAPDPQLTQNVKVIGNSDSKKYHLPGMKYYNAVKAHHRVEFNSEDEAIKAGYQKAPI